MDYDELITGYKKIIHDIYTTKPYYKRIRKLLINYKPQKKNHVKFNLTEFIGFLRSVFVIGVVNKGRRDYWKFMFWAFFNRPSLFVDAVAFSIYGYHFRTVYGLKKNKY
jgi:hypothetical protein